MQRQFALSLLTLCSSAQETGIPIKTLITGSGGQLTLIQDLFMAAASM